MIKRGTVGVHLLKETKSEQCPPLLPMLYGPHHIVPYSGMPICIYGEVRGPATYGSGLARGSSLQTFLRRQRNYMYSTLMVVRTFPFPRPSVLLIIRVNCEAQGKG